MTRSPGLNKETLSPTARTMPAASQPKILVAPFSGATLARILVSTGSPDYRAHLDEQIIVRSAGFGQFEIDQ